MTRPLHTGRRGSRAIPLDWDTQHRPTVAGTWTGSVQLRHPGATGTTWDPVDEQDVATIQVPYYDGPCRIQRLNSQGATPVVADDPEPISTYLVSLCADVEPVEGDIALVTCSGDPLLLDMVVAHVAVGTLRFERDLFCTITPRSVEQVALDAV